MLRNSRLDLYKQKRARLYSYATACLGEALAGDEEPERLLAAVGCSRLRVGNPAAAAAASTMDSFGERLGELLLGDLSVGLPNCFSRRK